MTFLNPAVLFGLIATAIPLLIHLLNLRKLKKIEFSSLQFLRELQKNKIRKVKLKQWLLLALRTLIILLLIGAFARPALKGYAVAGTSSAAKNTAVYIIDDSYSMTAVDANGSMFNQAKQKVMECLSLLKEGDDAAVLFVSRASAPDIRLSRDISALQKQVRDATASPVSRSIHEAMVKAAELVGASHNFNKEIYVFTDLQKGSLLRDTTSADLGEVLNSRVRIFLFPFQVNNVYNIGIDSMRINTAVFEKGKPLSVSVFVKNYSNTPARNEVVSVFQNTQRAAQKGITINPGEAAEVILESPLAETGFIQVKASLEEDAIPADNNCYAVIHVPEKIHIGFFAKNAADTKFVELALGALDSSNVFQISHKPMSAVNIDALSTYQAVFLFGADQTISGDKIRSYVTQGGGVFLAPGSDASMPEFNGALRQLQLPSATALKVPGAQKDFLLTFANVDYSHPLLSDIFQKGHSQQLQSPEFYGVFSIPVAGGVRPVFSFTDKSVFLGEYSQGKGRLLLSSAALVPQWTNFPYRAFFVPFIFRSVYYLSSLTGVQQNYMAGDEVPIPQPMTAFDNIHVMQPGGVEDVLSGNGPQARHFYPVTQTGVYSFRANDVVYAALPVNHDSRESMADMLQPSEFKAYLEKIHCKGTCTVYDRSVDAAQAIQQARYGSELWKLFLVLALCAAAVEMWLSKATRKEMVS
jgi:hypothetical protein